MGAYTHSTSTRTAGALADIPSVATAPASPHPFTHLFELLDLFIGQKCHDFIVGRLHYFTPGLRRFGSFSIDPGILTNLRYERLLFLGQFEGR